MIPDYLVTITALIAMLLVGACFYFYREDRRITEAALQSSIEQLVGVIIANTDAISSMREVVRGIGLLCPIARDREVYQKESGPESR